jgi:hypothetical protein
MFCRHLHLIERAPEHPRANVSFACTDCRSIVGVWDLPASHRRTIRYLSITGNEVTASLDAYAWMAHGSVVK